MSKCVPILRGNTLHRDHFSFPIFNVGGPFDGGAILEPQNVSLADMIALAWKIKSATFTVTASWSFPFRYHNPAVATCDADGFNTSGTGSVSVTIAALPMKSYKRLPDMGRQDPTNPVAQNYQLCANEADLFDNDDPMQMDEWLFVDRVTGYVQVTPLDFDFNDYVSKFGYRGLVIPGYPSNSPDSNAAPPFWPTVGVYQKVTNANAPTDPSRVSFQFGPTTTYGAFHALTDSYGGNVVVVPNQAPYLRGVYCGCDFSLTQYYGSSGNGLVLPLPENGGIGFNSGDSTFAPQYLLNVQAWTAGWGPYGFSSGHREIPRKSGFLHSSDFPTSPAGGSFFDAGLGSDNFGNNASTADVLDATNFYFRYDPSLGKTYNGGQNYLSPQNGYYCVLAVQSLSSQYVLYQVTGAPTTALDGGGNVYWIVPVTFLHGPGFGLGAGDDYTISCSVNFWNIEQLQSVLFQAPGSGTPTTSGHLSVLSSNFPIHYARSSPAGSFGATSAEAASAIITPTEYWPFKNRLGQPVYDTASGAQLNDPFG